MYIWLEPIFVSLCSYPYLSTLLPGHVVRCFCMIILQGIQSLLLTQLLPLYWLQWLMRQSASIQIWSPLQNGSADLQPLHTQAQPAYRQIRYFVKTTPWCLPYLISSCQIGWTPQAETFKIFICSRHNSQITCKNLSNSVEFRWRLPWIAVQPAAQHSPWPKNVCAMFVDYTRSVCRISGYCLQPTHIPKSLTIVAKSKSPNDSQDILNKYRTPV